MGASVVDPLDDGREWAAASSAGPQGHEADVLGDPNDADAVVSLGADRRRGVDSVAARAREHIVVGRVAIDRRIGVGADEVGAMDVVDYPIAVVVDSIERLVGIGPSDVGQVRVLEPVAAVDDRGNRGGRPNRPVPGAAHADVRARQGADEAVDSQPRVLESPELTEQGVVGNRERGGVSVTLGKHNGPFLFQLGDCLMWRLPGLGLDQLEAVIAEIALEVDVGFLAGRTALHRARARGPLDDHTVRREHDGRRLLSGGRAGRGDRQRAHCNQKQYDGPSPHHHKHEGTEP